MRSDKAVQAGAGAEMVKVDNPEHAPVFFLDGPPHRRKRTAIASFFTPKAVTTRYRDVMERTTDKLLSDFRRDGEARLDDISFELAVAVASEIIGLTNSDQSERARRFQKSLQAGLAATKKGLMRYPQFLRKAYLSLLLFHKDIKPAMKARKERPRDDILSHLLAENYSDKAILIECMTYGSAGMMTTREFIVMAAWYLFERPDLREQFVTGDEHMQLAILMEILRLEPVAALLHRRVHEGLTGPDGDDIAAGELYAIDIRAVNTDEKMVGACPFDVDPERATKQRNNGRFMSFGDGTHNCPGWQVALHETRVFLKELMSIPGVQLKSEPVMSWNNQLMSYELRNAIIACDPLPGA